MAGEAFELIQSTEVIEDFCVEFDRGIGGVAACAATGTFFCALSVRRTVRAQEEFAAATDDGILQCLLVDVAFQNRQAVVVRFDATDQHVIAVIRQMLNGNGGCNIVALAFHKFSGILSRNVLNDHIQIRVAADEGRQDFIEEAFFAIKDIEKGEKFGQISGI